jgi:ABC-2 type transport system ATP-binding protein
MTIRNLQSAKKTILLTTHYMFEADALCERIAVIDKGKIVALDTPEQIKNTVQDLSIVEIEVFGIPQEFLEKVRNLEFVDSVAVEDRGQRQILLVHTPKGASAVSDLIEALNGLRLGKIVTREPTLEDAYVRLVEGKT